MSKLEENAIQLCQQQRGDLEVQQIEAIAKLYLSLCVSRWYRGLISEAMKIGLIAASLARTVRSVPLRLGILPYLIHLFMSQCQYSRVVTKLRELGNFDEHFANWLPAHSCTWKWPWTPDSIAYANVDKLGQIWYYALCADLLLEAGVSIIPIHRYDQFYWEEKHVFTAMQDNEARRRFLTCMWLWQVPIFSFLNVW